MSQAVIENNVFEIKKGSDLDIGQNGTAVTGQSKSNFISLRIARIGLFIPWRHCPLSRSDPIFLLIGILISLPIFLIDAGAGPPPQPTVVDVCHRSIEGMWRVWIALSNETKEGAL